MIQKFDFQELDLKGAYRIKPFFATDNRGGLIIMLIYLRLMVLIMSLRKCSTLFLSVALFEQLIFS